MDLSPSLIYLICAIVISSLIGAYAWRHRNLRGCRAFAFLIFVSILWMSGSVFATLYTTYEGQWIGRAIQYIGIAGVSPALFVFIHRYCGKELSWKKIGLILIVPVLSWLVLGAPISVLWDLLQGTYGPKPPIALRGYYFWYVHLPYAYILLTISLVKVFLEITRTSRHYRGQVIMLFVAMCIPTIADLIGLTGVLGKLNVSPFSFLIFFSMVGVSIYRYQFLGSNPIAYETVFHTIRDSVIILDHDDIVRDINTSAAKRLGKDPREVIGLAMSEAFVSMPDLAASYEGQKGKNEDIHLTVADNARYLSLDITPIEDRDGVLSGRIVTLHDVTDRKHQQISLETMAFRDPLTLLANRRKFESEVEKAMQTTWETGKYFAILYFDLNRFKAVNDTLGHNVGDELLKFVAARVTTILRKPDFLARMGGDEFAVLLHDTNEAGVERVVERILASIERPFHIDEHTMSVGLSVGAAFYPADGKSLAQLIRHADSAMYRAKSEGVGLDPYSPGGDLEH